MDKNEALKQIETIMDAFEAGNRIFLSGTHMIVFGILIFIIPVIEFGTFNFTFGMDFLKQPVLNTAMHVALYWILFTSIHHFFLNRKKHKVTANPAIRKAMTVNLPVLVAMLGSIVALASAGESRLICPVALLFLGIFINLLGQFSIRIVRTVSWSYIALGIILIFLAKYDFPGVWIIFTSYVGISYMIMGLMLKKNI